jgi:glyoxylase-like metal-dependent hydrolase (beta-lactamase superfamily II)
MKIPACVYILFLCTISTINSQATAADEIPVETHRISNRVLVITCLSNNVTAIAAEAGLIVIDTHRSPSLMDTLASHITNTFGRSDFTYVVNTHGHWDHSSGNQCFGNQTIVGQENCREYIRQSFANARRRRWQQQRQIVRLEERAAEGEDVDGTLLIQRIILNDLEDNYAPTPPTDTFQDRLSVDVGDVTLELYYCGWAHTDHDVLVFVPEEKLLFTGDIFCSANGFCFAVNALTDAPRLTAALDDILEKEPAEITVIPGHGEFLTRDDLQSLRDLLERKYREVDLQNSAARIVFELFESQNSESALEQIKAIDVDGMYVSEEEFYGLARRYLGRGKTEETVAILQFALVEHPQSALLHDVIAETYLKHGDVQSAVQNYEMSLRLEPANRNAEEMLEMLRAGSEVRESP